MAIFRYCGITLTMLKLKYSVDIQRKQLGPNLSSFVRTLLVTEDDDDRRHIIAIAKLCSGIATFVSQVHARGMRPMQISALCFVFYSLVSSYTSKIC